MLTAVVRFSLRYRGVVIALACVFFAYGVFTLSRAKYDVFPEFAPPQAVIQTEAPGLSPEQVEVLVTLPDVFPQVADAPKRFGDGAAGGAPRAREKHR